MINENLEEKDITHFVEAYYPRKLDEAKEMVEWIEASEISIGVTKAYYWLYEIIKRNDPTIETIRDGYHFMFFFQSRKDANAFKEKFGGWVLKFKKFGPWFSELRGDHYSCHIGDKLDLKTPYLDDCREWWEEKTDLSDKFYILEYKLKQVHVVNELIHDIKIMKIPVGWNTNLLNTIDKKIKD